MYFLVLLVGATICLTGMLHFYYSIQTHYDVGNKVELHASSSLVNPMLTKEIKFQPPSKPTDKLLFLKVDQVNLSLYESNISAHANTLIVDYPPSKNFVVFNVYTLQI